PGRSTSITPGWIFPRAARPSPTGWKVLSSAPSTRRRSRRKEWRAEWSPAFTRRAPPCPNSRAHEARPVAHGATWHMRDGWTVAMMSEEAEGGRIFFSSTGRSLVDEDEIVVLSVGVDIGSSTSHLVFSRIVLERLDSRYVVTTRETFYQSDILLTPYSAEEEIDAEALGAFIERQYRDANVDPDEIDTGALILTGVAVRRRNARKIGELFARQAGKMVAVSAGDSLETGMAAHGSGAGARSIRDRVTVMNVDVGGGTSKIAICVDGRVSDLTALDVGARLVCLDPAGRIVRVEEAARRFGAELGIALDLGGELAPDAARTRAARMGDRPFEAMAGGSPASGGAGAVVRHPAGARTPIHQLTFSGGVAEYIYGREAQTYG